MSEWMDILRGPVLGVIVMILLLAGVLIIAAFAALVAQMSLLFRLRPWISSESRADPGKAGAEERHASARESAPLQRCPPALVVLEPQANEGLDADGWDGVQP